MTLRGSAALGIGIASLALAGCTPYPTYPTPRSYAYYPPGCTPSAPPPPAPEAPSDAAPIAPPPEASDQGAPPPAATSGCRLVPVYAYPYYPYYSYYPYPGYYGYPGYYPYPYTYPPVSVGVGARFHL